MPTIESEGRKYWQSSKDYQLHRSRNMSFYNSTAWRKLRDKFIRDNPFCMVCLEKKRMVPSYYVDHKRRINEGGAMLDEANLQTLCKKCDAQKRQHERGGCKSRKENHTTTQPYTYLRGVKVWGKGG